MAKRLAVLYLYLSLFTGGMLYAKPETAKLDSLNIALKNAKDDTGKVMLLYSIANIVDKNDAQEAMVYARQAMQLSEKLRYDYGKLLASYAIGKCNGRLHNVPEAIRNFQNTLSIATKLKHYEKQGDAYTALGISYNQLNESNRAIEHYKLAATCYQKGGVDQTSKLNGNIASVYISNDDFREGANYVLKAINTYKGNDKVQMAHLYNNAGGAYIGLEQYDSALYYLHKCNENARLANLTKYEATSSNNIALAYVNIAKANKRMQADSLNNKTYLLQQAGVFVNHGLTIARQLKDPYIQQKSFKVLNDLSREKGDNVAALRYTDSVLALKEYLYSDDVKREISKIEAEYRVRITTDSLHTQNILKDSELKTKSLQRNSSLLLLLATGVIATLTINRQRLKHKQKLALVEAEKQHLSANARRQLTEVTRRVYEKNEIIEAASQEIERLQQLTNSNTQVDYNIIDQLKQSVLLTDEQWDNFKHNFDKVHAGFISKLLDKMPGITPAEMRFVVLSKLNLSNKEMAAMLGVTSDAMRINKHRLMKKFNIDDAQRLENLIQSI